jgi:hypothetical protein
VTLRRRIKNPSPDLTQATGCKHPRLRQSVVLRDGLCPDVSVHFLQPRQTAHQTAQTTHLSVCGVNKCRPRRGAGVTVGSAHLPFKSKTFTSPCHKTRETIGNTGWESNLTRSLVIERKGVRFLVHLSVRPALGRKNRSGYSLSAATAPLQRCQSLPSPTAQFSYFIHFASGSY